MKRKSFLREGILFAFLTVQVIHLMTSPVVNEQRDNWSSFGQILGDDACPLPTRSSTLLRWTLNLVWKIRHCESMCFVNCPDSGFDGHCENLFSAGNAGACSGHYNRYCSLPHNLFALLCSSNAIPGCLIRSRIAFIFAGHCFNYGSIQDREIFSSRSTCSA